MGIPEELRDQVLAYCGLCEPGEQDMLVLNDAWDAACAYLSGADVTKPAEDAPEHALWLHVMMALTLDMYDQRGAQFEQGKLQDNPAFRRQLVQLRLRSQKEE